MNRRQAENPPRPGPKSAALSPVAVAVCLIAGLVIVTLFLAGTFDRLEYGLYDWVHLNASRPPAPGKVAVVAIDDASVAALGQWPFPRRYHARLIAQLQAAGAKVVAVDLLLTEPDRMDPDGDKALEAAIARSGRVVLALSGSHKALARDASAFALLPPILTPLPAYAAAGARLGHVLVVPETDGVVRRLPLYASVDGRRLPGLALQAALSYGLDHELAEPPRGDRASRWWLDFRRRGGWAAYSYSDVLAGRFPAGAFQGKVVLVGATGSGFHDYYATPVSDSGNPTPGLHIHAQAIANLLSGDSISWAPRWAVSFVVLLISLLGAAPGRVARPRATRVALLTLAGLAACVAAATVSFARLSLWLPLTPVCLATAVSGAILIGRGTLQTERERSHLRQALSRYLSPQVLAELLASRTPVSLGGQKAQVTVLFADLRGFTQFAESRSPEEAVQVLNVYLQAVAAPILDRRGTLDKFTGDGVMAIFGAPAPLPNHALVGITCAEEILAAVRRLNSERRTRGETTLEVGLGLATGAALVGNVGSAIRMDYTAIGDVVNLAARLEKEARAGEAVVTLETVAAAGTRYTAMPVESLAVRGRVEPARVVRVVTQVTD